MNYEINDNEWPERDMAQRVHSYLPSRINIIGEPIFTRDSDPELFDALTILSPILLEISRGSELPTYTRVLASMLIEYFGVGEYGKACTNIAKWRLEKYGETYEKSLVVIGDRININDYL